MAKVNKNKEMTSLVKAEKTPSVQKGNSSAKTMKKEEKSVEKKKSQAPKSPKVSKEEVTEKSKMTVKTAASKKSEPAKKTPAQPKSTETTRAKTVQTKKKEAAAPKAVAPKAVAPKAAAPKAAAPKAVAPKAAAPKVILAKEPIAKTEPHAKKESVEKAKVSPKKETPYVPSILKQEEGETPSYRPLEEVDASKPRKIEFSKIIPHDDILQALHKSGLKYTDENIQKILQSVLRGSDVFLLKPSLPQSYLIGAIGSIYKILSGALTRVEAKQPMVLILGNDDRKIEDLYQNSLKTFSDVGVAFHVLKEETIENTKDVIQNKQIDVLFSTVKNFEKIGKEVGINLNSIGLCFVYNLHQIAHHNLSGLVDILTALPNERVQKVFLATENTPKSRELAFEYLEEVEYLNFLPSYVKDRSPKQFAHALTATQKFQVLLGHLKVHNPACAGVFANSRAVAEWVAYKLHNNGIKVELVTTKMNFMKRRQLLKSIQDGNVNVVVTTDFFNSTLGIENLSCLYHFDLPDTPKHFLQRLNLIEKSKSSVSISFICEDYGFNMGKIEDHLGFKIQVVEPDKEYFSFKDESDYPLEADGRVKRIGQVYADPVITPVAAAPVASMTSMNNQPRVQKADTATPRATMPGLSPRPSVADVTPRASMADQSSQGTSNSRVESNFIPKPQTERPRTQGNRFENSRTDARVESPKFENRFDNKQDSRFDNKFIRRDDKAKEAIDAARLAAQEKRKASQSQNQGKSSQKNIFSLAVYIVQDAIKAAKNAAKDSISSNIEQNLPIFSGVLSKMSFLKKEK